MLGAGALGRPRGMVWGGRREEASGWGTCVFLWRIHIDIWQNQYNIVKLKNKIKKIYIKRIIWLRVLNHTPPNEAYQGNNYRQNPGNKIQCSDSEQNVGA